MTQRKLPPVPPMSWYDIGRRADTLLARVYPEVLRKPQPVPIDDFLEQELRKIFSFEYEVQDLRGDEGRVDPVDRLVILDVATYDGLQRGEGRARFTTAHEIGHVELHSKYFQKILRDGRKPMQLRRTRIEPFRDPDYQADAFAGALLMPTHHMIRLVAEGKETAELAEIFSVSKQAAQVRKAKLPLFLPKKAPW